MAPQGAHIPRCAGCCPPPLQPGRPDVLPLLLVVSPAHPSGSAPRSSSLNPAVFTVTSKAEWVVYCPLVFVAL